jgi:hypothetical protein
MYHPRHTLMREPSIEIRRYHLRRCATLAGFRSFPCRVAESHLPLTVIRSTPIPIPSMGRARDSISTKGAKEAQAPPRILGFRSLYALGAHQIAHHSHPAEPLSRPCILSESFSGYSSDGPYEAFTVISNHIYAWRHPALHKYLDGYAVHLTIEEVRLDPGAHARLWTIWVQSAALDNGSSKICCKSARQHASRAYLA